MPVNVLGIWLVRRGDGGRPGWTRYPPVVGGFNAVNFFAFDQDFILKYSLDLEIDLEEPGKSCAVVVSDLLWLRMLPYDLCLMQYLLEILALKGILMMFPKLKTPSSWLAKAQREESVGEKTYSRLQAKSRSTDERSGIGCRVHGSRFHCCGL